MQSYGSPCVLDSFTKDPDTPLDFNMDQDIIQEWSCVDLALG
jgi:hypothetical protein